MTNIFLKNIMINPNHTYCIKLILYIKIKGITHIKHMHTGKVIYT